jgi:hypothetical protein
MVKKKNSKKKVVKPKVSKKRNVSKKIKSSKNIPMNKSDFKTFEFGVQRLKELENELNSLDTRGFSREAGLIKSKLKTVSEVPNIEKELKVLKLKIQKKYKPKRRKESSTKKISENLEDIKNQIKNLKTKRSNIPVDSGVDILVDVNFNNFLSSVKKNLSDRIKSKEEELDNLLKKDLDNRDFKYKKKHNNLLRDFENHKEKLEQFYKKKYNQKVESTLHKEISEKFNKMLNEKMNKEKIELGKVYRGKLKQHFSDIFNKRKQDLEEDFNKKKENFEMYKEDVRKKMHDKLIIETHKQLLEELSKKEIILRKQLKSEYEINLKKHMQEHEQELKQKKLDLELEMQKKIKQVLK